MNNTQDILTIEKVFELNDLSLTQRLVFYVLCEMKLREEKINVEKLAKYCGFCSATVQRAINALTTRGYLNKERTRLKGRFFVKYEITDKVKTSVLKQG